jgi:hypothetical protein
MLSDEGQVVEERIGEEESVSFTDLEHLAAGLAELKHFPKAKGVERLGHAALPDSSAAKIIQIRNEDRPATHAKHFPDTPTRMTHVVKHSERGHHIEGIILEIKAVGVS